MKNTLFILSLLVSSMSLGQTVTIGTQVWMTKNLDVATFRNGDPIPEAKTDEEWEKAGENKQPAWCYYENDPANGAKYGKLYNWYAVNDPRGLAPEGYHIPSEAEWYILDDFLSSEVGTKMKSAPIYETKIRYVDEGGYYEEKWVPCSNCSYWTEKQKANNPCTVCRNTGGKTVRTGKYIPKTKIKVEDKTQIGGWDGTNSSGFSALPGGIRDHDGRFNYCGSGYDCNGCWWSSNNYSGVIKSTNMKSYSPYLYFDLNSSKDGLSVRCIKD